MISIDSVDGIEFTGTVFFVSSAGEEDVNGIVTYKVLIKYNDENKKIRNGMWVTVDFITKEALDAIIVPVAAVKPYNNKPHVKNLSWEYIEVIPGLTDGKIVEIISGLKKGDKILVEE